MTTFDNHIQQVFLHLQNRKSPAITDNPLRYTPTNVALFLC